MIREMNVFGVLISSMLITTPLTFAITFLIRSIFVRTGFYRLVWHPPLFDAAVFMIVWSMVVRLPLPF
ncbi:MAG TPA: DUF1656 domain-containing protein [Zoogloea sp.]|jgi:protein-S-isoprenylcysteine O-methyltransferase Ste14|uniref:DUF1656 domain-containing protein n=1 Tax=Zoogloea sp. TaxID=49181 RepID=UPI001B769847|nr:DUF1656 domain-containing protein [Zoogloea sp.]MBP8267852.1 DUF1656 domain-containing protein [Zoogloea sp.]HOB44874.1 DUF1656 domain-containing protein [Zoogloea sp.]HQA09323.1 DUF1656 domain-containing protein [Zoogloea sp.]HQE37896.1 DUF1656 domain-containing protein [Zoogloea sp.]